MLALAIFRLGLRKYFKFVPLEFCPKCTNKALRMPMFLWRRGLERRRVWRRGCGLDCGQNWVMIMFSVMVITNSHYDSYDYNHKDCRKGVHNGSSI